MSVVVVGALREEIAPLAEALAGRPAAPIGEWLQCRAGDRDVRLMAAGDGLPTARLNVERLLAETRPEVLIGLGVAGGLTEDLAVGDVILADRVLDEASGSVRSCPESPWRDRAEGTGAIPAIVVSAGAIAGTVAERRRLARLALSAPAVVDLESASWAEAATAAGIPFVVLRGISDGHDEELPLDFQSLRDASGSIDRSRVVVAALGRPRSWPGLLRLRRRLRRVAADLAEATVEVLAA